MVRPDRRPVPDPLRIVPHTVGIDHRSACLLRDPDHPSIDVMRHARDHCFRRITEAIPWPVLAHKLVVTADPARRDEDSAGVENKFANGPAARLLAALYGGGFKNLASDPGTCGRRS